MNFSAQRLLICCVLLLPAGCSQAVQPLEVSRTAYQVGFNTIEIVESRASGSELVFLNLHDDENTSVDAALEVISRKGGRLVELQHSGFRLINFDLDDIATFTVDPNRIFTEEGTRNTLDRYSFFMSGAAREIEWFAGEILKQNSLMELDVILTLHNNGPDGYSTLSYLDGGEYVTDAADVFLAANQDPDNFYFVTDRTLFEKLKDAGFNAVLQNNTEATDDGSLSVLAGIRGVPYINVEAEHGDLSTQIKMIETVYEILQ